MRDAPTELVDLLRQRIIAGLDAGRLHAGDRLPSIRTIVAETGYDHRDITRAYHVLRDEGLVEIRDRSGVYVASNEQLGGEAMAETARWLADVVAEGWLRRIGVRSLPDVVRRATAGVRLRAACVESVEDHMFMLREDLRGDFGFDTYEVRLGERGGVGRHGESLQDALRGADLVATTSAHALAARAAARRLGKPCVTVTLHPDGVRAVDRRLREGAVAFLVVDPRFEPRIRHIYERYNERVDVVLADDADAIARLPETVSVIISRAARERLGGLDHPLLLAGGPFMSPASAREIAAWLVRLNLEDARPSPPGFADAEAPL